MLHVIILSVFLLIAVGSFFAFKRILETELSLPKFELKNIPMGMLYILAIAALAVPGMILSFATFVLNVAVWLLA